LGKLGSEYRKASGSELDLDAFHFEGKITAEHHAAIVGHHAAIADMLRKCQFQEPDEIDRGLRGEIVLLEQTLVRQTSGTRATRQGQLETQPQNAAGGRGPELQTHAVAKPRHAAAGGDDDDHGAAGGGDATTLAPTDGDSGRPPISARPPAIAFRAWYTRDLLAITQGEPKQEQIAETMRTQGLRAQQGQVSKWLKAVKKYLAAGGILPAVDELDSIDTVDPDVIDMGPRQDGRTPRQRLRRDPDADSDE